MKMWRGIIVSLVVLGFQSGLSARGLDPFWMYADSVDLIYSYFACHDTLRQFDMYDYKEIDTVSPESYDGSNFFKFDYQFSADSQFFKDEFSGVVKWKGLRPGYAGFKTAWDGGMTGFPVARYKYIVLAYKGPLPTHKVTIKFWYNNGGCGVPSFNEEIGTFTASDTWKVDTIPIPQSVQDKSDSARNFKYYEMVFLINNVDPNGPPTSAKGSLSIDNIRLVGRNPIDTSPSSKSVSAGQAVQFHVATSIVNTTDMLTYQWKKNGADIAGANNPAYAIASATSGDVGDYSVAVTVNSKQTFTSQKGTLTIQAPQKKSGCGSGFCLAFFPPMWFKVRSYLKRKKRDTQA